MPIIQTATDLRASLSAARDAISNAQSALTSLNELQRSLEGQNADTSIIYNILRPRYDTVYDMLREAAQELLAANLRPEIHCKVGWPSSYTTNVITTSSSPPTLADAITTTATPFGGLASGDVVEILEAEDAANQRTIAIDDTPGATTLATGFLTLTANAADTTLEMRQRGTIAICQTDTTKVAATTITTNAKGSGVCSITGLDGVLCGLSIHRNGAIDEFDTLVVSKRPVCTLTSLLKAASALGQIVTPPLDHQFKTGDLIRFEGISDAGWVAMNGRTFSVASPTATAFTLTSFNTTTFGADLTDDQGLVFCASAPSDLHIIKKADMTSQTLSIQPGLRLRPTDTLYIGIVSDDASATADVVAFCV